MNKRNFLSLIIAILALTNVAASHAKPLQTQMTLDGNLDVDVNRAKVDGTNLMIVLTYINATNKDIGIKYPLKDVYYIDKKDSLKYHVLRDSKKEWLAAPVARGSIARETGIAASPILVKAEGRATVWFRFPAPSPGTKKIDLIVPGILPFDNLALSK